MTTQTTPTPYGDVEFETVECDSCGDEMLEKNAYDFTMGGKDGLACEYCVENGPIEFPGPDPMHVWGFLFCLAIWPLVTCIMIKELSEDNDNQVRFYFLGVVGALLWGSLVALGGIGLL